MLAQAVNIPFLKAQQAVHCAPVISKPAVQVPRVPQIANAPKTFLCLVSSMATLVKMFATSTWLSQDLRVHGVLLVLPVLGGPHLLVVGSGCTHNLDYYRDTTVSPRRLMVPGHAWKIHHFARA